MRVSIGDVSLFFEVLGREWVVDEEGKQRRRPAIVAVHGGPGIDGTLVRHQLAPLADVAQIVVPDQRGHGRSDYGDIASWNLATWAADVKAFCDALELELPIVLGVSFGGAVVQKYAATYPEHPRAIVLVSTGPRFPTGDELVERFREVGGDEAADVTRRDYDAPNEETLAEWMRVCLPLLTRAPGRDPGFARARGAGIATTDVNLHFMSGEVKTLDLRAELANVGRPTLVLAGEHDPMVPVRLREELLSAIPDELARLVVVRDAAHSVFNDNPHETYGAVRDFLRSLPDA